ncbi:thioredoxin [Candidatus Microgenomates bacterium]|nr:thioredoxin [Candidatus Microgenomates bacterium]
MPNPLILDDYSFDKEILSSGKVALIDFWAPWCGPCKILGPVIEEIAKDMEDKIIVGKVNVDENPIVAGRYKIMSIPAMLIFKEGKIVDNIIGAQPKDNIVKRIESALK